MTNVRKMSKTAFSLLFFVILFAVLMSLSHSATGGVFYKLNEILSSKRMIGGYHSFIITLSFWILLIAGFIDSALRELSGIYVLTSFIIPIVLCVIVFFISLVGLAAYIDIRIFWMLYYIGEIICVRVMFNKISYLKEAKPTAMLAVPLLIESLYKKINQTIKKSGKEPLVNSMLYISNVLRNVGIDIRRKVFSEILENLGGNMRIIVSAAAPMDKKIGKWVENIGIEFLQGYGLTETAPIAALTPEADPRIGSVGKAVVGAEIKIKDPDENGEGEVLIKSETLMLGYYEMPEETAEVVKDGWFNSGDVGYLDKDGYLYITGRSKNVIVTANGKNIYPEEIETLLAKVPLISECMVYGKGEKDNLTVSLKVIPNYTYINENIGKDLSEEEIYNLIWEEVKKINKGLTSYKAIKYMEIKHDEFEKTTTMKIKRYAELQKDKLKEEEAKKASKKSKK